jgi:hypothetical protein
MQGQWPGRRDMAFARLQVKRSPDVSGFGQTSGDGGFSAAPSDKKVLRQRFRGSGDGFGKELLKEQTPITGSGYFSA